jgi:hypothetical protein
MFVVKAQYRAETRKFIFKQFPTWDELYEQVMPYPSPISFVTPLSQ